MPSRNYRLLVLGCALSWFLVGMHFTVLHEVTHHHRMPDPGILAILLLLAATGSVTLWMLLRDPARSH